ncbi:hypothetical protein GN958_ATG14774 [Phytophthora infestans]|nr:hypothetical protein GN958_ATG14774 [Phytophthora infestans]
MTSQYTTPAPWIVVAKLLTAGSGVAVVLPSLGDAVILGALLVRVIIPLAALEQPVEDATFWTVLVAQPVEDATFWTVLVAQRRATCRRRHFLDCAGRAKTPLSGLCWSRRWSLRLLP